MYFRSVNDAPINSVYAAYENFLTCASDTNESIKLKQSRKWKRLRSEKGNIWPPSYL